MLEVGEKFTLTPTQWAMRTFPQGGYYVEAGAHDGVGDSVTLELERSGKWRGLCVEPSSAYRALKVSRTCNTDNRCLWHESGRVLFREILDGDVELSGIPYCFYDHWDRTTRNHAELIVPAVSLTQLLRDHQAPAIIEFMCLDTEGSEMEILTAHDFSAYRFKLLCVEHNGVDARKQQLRNLLVGKRGYRHIHDSGRDDYFVDDSSDGVL